LDDFDVFFFRQRFNEPTQALIPELKPSCVCREILNPDDDIALCPNEMCGQYMHVSCLRHNADRKCYDCKTEFPLRDLVSSLKRHHKEESKNETSHQSDDEGVSGNAKKRRKIDEDQEASVEPARKFLLSIKSDEVANKLDKYIRELKAKNDLAT
jgi:hypothetical protein